MVKKPQAPPVLQEDTRDQQIAELTADLQRVRADFENYQKRVESEKIAAQTRGEAKTVMRILPVVDTIERAVAHIPEDIAAHQWVQGVAGLVKQLEKALAEIGLKRIPASHGEKFNPELHQAVQMDDEAEGDDEVVVEELQAGYVYDGVPIRHSMVKVSRR